MKILNVTFGLTNLAEASLKLIYCKINNKYVLIYIQLKFYFKKSFEV
jgi:hypothetical protein